MALKAERRFLPAEVRASGDAVPKFSGYVTKFGLLSQVIYDFQERFAAGCFDDCLAGNPDVFGLYNHDTNQVLGRTSSGSMRLSVDQTGLAYEIDSPGTTMANDLVLLMRRGDVRGSSIGFYPLEQTWDIDPMTDMLIRTIVKAAIFDVSVVTDPAYLASDAQVRSALDGKDESLRDLAAEQRRLLKEGPPPQTRGWSAAEQWSILEQLELDDLSSL